MTPTKGLHPPGREGVPAPVEDPAIVAAKEAQEAAAAFSAIAKTCRTSDDETSPEFVAADNLLLGALRDAERLAGAS